MSTNPWTAMAVPNMSRQAKVMSITRLIQHFDDKNISQFKQQLFDCVNVTNEKEFLCKILPIIQKSMLSNESINLLKSTVVKMAEKQKIPIATATNSKSHNRITIYKFVTQCYKDRLSRLPSSIIGHIASYLEQSLKVGYLNKQLYIESQSLSFISNVSSNLSLQLYITDTALDRILINVSNTYSYSLPAALFLFRRRKLSLEPRFNSLLSSQWFTTLFSRLQVLHVHEQYFAFIPFKTLFAIKNRNISSDYNINKNEIMIDKNTNVDNQLTLVDVTTLLSLEQEFDSHCDIFCQKYSHCCKWINSDDMNGYGMRKIGRLKICTECMNFRNWSAQQCAKYISKGKKLVLGLSRNYIRLSWCIPAFNISNLGELENIFHGNLQYFQLKGFQSQVGDTNFTKLEKEYLDKKENKWQNKPFLCKKLKIISVITSPSFLIWFLSGYDKIDLFYYVETFEIPYCPQLINGNIHQTMTNIVFDPRWSPIFDRVFWARYHKNPFLKAVYISLSDDEFLHQFSVICLYLIRNRQNIGKTNIRCVTFFWTKFYKVSLGDEKIRFQSEQAQRHAIFGYQLNQNQQNNCSDVIFKSNNRTYNAAPCFHYKLKDISQRIFGMVYKSLIEKFEGKNVTQCVTVSNVHEAPKLAIVQIDFDIVNH